MSDTRELFEPYGWSDARSWFEQFVQEAEGIDGERLSAVLALTAAPTEEPVVSDLLALMEKTTPKGWPAPRGYGYGGNGGQRYKTWHTWVVRWFAARLAPQRETDHE